MEWEQTSRMARGVELELKDAAEERDCFQGNWMQRRTWRIERG